MMTPMAEVELAKAVGDELAYWRRRRGMSRAELAKKVDRSANTIGRWERGDTMPDVSETWRVADALGVSVGTLMTRAEQALEAGGGYTKEPMAPDEIDPKDDDDDFEAVIVEESTTPLSESEPTEEPTRSRGESDNR